MFCQNAWFMLQPADGTLDVSATSITFATHDHPSVVVSCVPPDEEPQVLSRAFRAHLALNQAYSEREKVEERQNFRLFLVFVEYRQTTNIGKQQVFE